MKISEKELLMGRRNALKMLGLGSAAMLTAGFGKVLETDPLENKGKPKPKVGGDRSPVSFTTGENRKQMMF